MFIEYEFRIHFISGNAGRYLVSYIIEISVQNVQSIIDGVKISTSNALKLVSEAHIAYANIVSRYFYIIVFSHRSYVSYRVESPYRMLEIGVAEYSAAAKVNFTIWKSLSPIRKRTISYFIMSLKFKGFVGFILFGRFHS